MSLNFASFCLSNNFWSAALRIRRPQISRQYWKSSIQELNGRIADTDV
jgi:hypothetical protein